MVAEDIRAPDGYSAGPVAGLQNHSILSAVEIAEQRTVSGNSGDRKWSTTTAFTVGRFD